MAQEGDKFITITRNLYVAGKLFKVNNQYCYSSRVDRSFGCGCGGKKKTIKSMFVVIEDGKTYEVDPDYAIESTIPIAKNDQSFEDRRQFIGDDRFIADYDPYRVKNNPNAIAASANDIPM